MQKNRKAEKVIIREDALGFRKDKGLEAKDQIDINIGSYWKEEVVKEKS